MSIYEMMRAIGHPISLLGKPMSQKNKK